MKQFSLFAKLVPGAYERILDRIAPDQKAKVDAILRIVVGVRRPLSVQEMAMALGVATHRNTETATEAGLTFDGLGKKLRRGCGLS